MENIDKNFLTFDEAAKLLGIHRTTLQLWIRKNKESKENNMVSPYKCPPYGRMGGRYRFKKEDIEIFIKESMNRGE